MLKTDRLQFSYEESTSFEFPIIDLKDSENLLVLGESGAGKSTLLKLLSGLLSPHSGSIQLNETVLTDLKSSDLDSYRGKEIGLIFQKSHFINSISVLENLLLVLFLAGLKKNKDKALALLKEVGLGDKVNSFPRDLSVGQQQRLSIASVLIKEPSLILADESTSSLDDKNCRIVIDLIKSQAERTQANLIIVTHDSRLKREFNKVLEL